VIHTHTDTVVCSAYTPQYTAFAGALANSLAVLGVPHRLYPYAGTRTETGWVAWMVNCHRTVDFTLRALLDHPAHPVFFVNADATFESYPRLFGELKRGPYDAAVYYMPDDGKLANGSIWLRNNGRVLAMWCEFLEMCRERLRLWLATEPEPDARPPQYVWEQTLLHAAFPALTKKYGLCVTTLPDAYCRIFDKDEQDAVDPVVMHWQGARQLGPNVRPSSEPVVEAFECPRARAPVGETPRRCICCRWGVCNAHDNL
jgi:hypothetical protein